MLYATEAEAHGNKITGDFFCSIWHIYLLDVHSPEVDCDSIRLFVKMHLEHLHAHSIYNDNTHTFVQLLNLRTA